MPRTAGPRGAPGQPSRAQTISILTGASIMLSLGMGMRQSLGLFMVPVTHDLGLTASDFTFALAIQNIAWGLSQPFIGALADRRGARPVMVAGSLCYAAGLGITMTATGLLGLVMGAGMLIGIALSCTASSMAMSASAKTASPARRSMVLGIVSAAGSLGTFMAAPMAQGLIAGYGWHVALAGFIALAAAMLPAAFIAGGSDKHAYDRGSGGASADAGMTLRGVLGEASRHRGYVTMSIAFFVCGLQLVFLTTHLPTYLANCGQDPMLGAQALATIGIFNAFGSWLCGWLGGRYPKQVLLGIIYIVRSLAIATYFIMPVSTASTLVFAAVMGTLWLGVAPLVNGLVAQIFGLRFMTTLSGVAFMSHQVGSFLGAWGGGVIYDALGSYDRAWQSAVIVGVVAGLAQMTMDDRPTERVAAAALA
jgi:predicted MFS family arabinose efflux permease